MLVLDNEQIRSGRVLAAPGMGGFLRLLGELRCRMPQHAQCHNASCRAHERPSHCRLDPELQAPGLWQWHLTHCLHLTSLEPSLPLHEAPEKMSLCAQLLSHVQLALPLEGRMVEVNPVTLPLIPTVTVTVMLMLTIMITLMMTSQSCSRSQARS